MTAIIENKHTIPRHPAHVLDAEKTLRAEAPALYKKISSFRDSKNWQCYETAKWHLERSGLDYGQWIKTITDFCNV